MGRIYLLRMYSVYFFSLIPGLILLISFPSPLFAGTSGTCSNCHTMHNSQNGSSVTGGAPNDYLLITCIACHTGSTGWVNSSGAPIIMHTSDPGGQGGNKTLAGGDYYWVATGYGEDNTKGHNVDGITGSEDQNIGFEPPGWDPNATPGFLNDGQIADGNWGSNRLTCAGKYGCHGNHVNDSPFESIRGAHHSNVGGQLTGPTTIGNSYRFLGGIEGYEDNDWQWTENSIDHNEYKGVNDVDGRRYDTGSTQYNDKSTISYLCAECHGNFHSRISNDDTGVGPWRRHPTDVALPAGGEYIAYTTFDPAVPVGRASIPGSSGDGMSDAIVICLSCHRAHGSDQPDLLRFNYDNMISGSSNTGGCFTCHSSKNIDP